MIGRGPIGNEALDTLFREARTHTAWRDSDVENALIETVYDLMKWGPTSANCSPARFVFVKSKEGKERLRPHLDKGNVEKTMAAPVTAIIAYDLKFYEHMGRLFPHAKDARSWFENDEKKAFDTAFRNGTLQGGYLILAARAMGLDCGPMSGFNEAGVNTEFFKDGNVRVNFLCNIGHGNPEKLYPRGPRFGFDEVCKIL